MTQPESLISELAANPSCLCACVWPYLIHLLVDFDEAVPLLENQPRIIHLVMAAQPFHTKKETSKCTHCTPWKIPSHLFQRCSKSIKAEAKETSTALTLNFNDLKLIPHSLSMNSMSSTP